MIRLAGSLDRLLPRYDVIVVGSGYGGGVAASRLARAGLSVAVLERGREFAPGDFPTRFPEFRQELQLTGRQVRTGSPDGLYDVRLGEDMHVLVGCGLGGGSLINAGVALRPDPRVFRDAVWPEPVTRDGLLDEGYARALQWLRPTRDPAAGSMSKYQVLRAGGRALEQEPVAAPVTVTFEDTINAAGAEQPGCRRCGDCCGGCNVGAKNTVAATYLHDAARHGASIFTHAVARRVEKLADGTWKVHLRHAGAQCDQTAFEVTARTVVLAAGTFGSTEILLRSRERGLALSDRLGQGFSANGDIVAFGYGAKFLVNAIGIGHPPKLAGIEVGACVSGQIEIVDDTHLESSLTIQEGTLPSALAPLLPVLFLPNGRLLGAMQSLIAGVYKGPFARLQAFFVVSHDSAAGQLRLEDDRVALSWPGVAEEPVYRRCEAMLKALTTQVGAAYVKNPLAGTTLGRKPSTAHPLGGCGMGRERGCGVIDHKGRVFDAGRGAGAADVHEGLYVVDGAIMPRSLGANPLLTIAALAERTMLHLARDLGRTFDAAPVHRAALGKGTPAEVAATES